jgi:hypothetical protein
MKKRNILYASAFVLTIASLGHLIRAISGWEVFINGWNVPVWLSILLFAVAGVLAHQLWKLAK